MHKRTALKHTHWNLILIIFIVIGIIIERVKIKVKVWISNFLKSLFFHFLTFLMKYWKLINNIFPVLFFFDLFHILIMFFAFFAFFEHLSNLTFRIKKPWVMRLVFDTAYFRHLLVLTKKYLQWVRGNLSIVKIVWLMHMINMILMHQLKGDFVHFNMVVLIHISLWINRPRSSVVLLKISILKSPCLSKFRETLIQSYL